MWVPTFNCGSDVCVTHEWYFLCSVIQLFRRWCDGVYITPKCSKFMDARLFTITWKARWGMSRSMCTLHLWTFADFYFAQNHLFLCLLLSRRPAITILWMLLLCLSLFTFIQYASPPVVSLDILNSSTSKFVTYVEFANDLSLLILTRLHGCCLFICVVRIKLMTKIGTLLDVVGKNHIIIVFAQTTFSTEIKLCIEVTL